jgi:S1-C subfamily serine protease/sugar lactone lactonase YvrE
MQRRVCALFAFLLVFVLCGLSADKKKQKTLTAAEVFKQSVPAVVVIDCLGPNNTRAGTASGFIVSAKGKIVTNLHVIQTCQGLTVRLTNGDIYDTADVLEVDARRDLALIRIKAVELPVLPLADSNSVEVGQPVFSIGNPSGLQNTLQQGLVSGFREVTGYRLMQVSASINPGNSGGPILDEQGQVVAVSAAKIQGAENLGFAIPIDYVKGLLDSKNEISFTAFATALKAAGASGVNASVATPPAIGGVVGGVPGGLSGITAIGAVPPPPSSAPKMVEIASEQMLPPASYAQSKIETFAGRDWKFSGDGLPALQVPLSHIYGVAVDRAGSVYAADHNNQAIVKIDQQGQLHVLAGPDSPAQNRPVNPYSIAVDGFGGIYFGEDGQRLRKLLPSGQVVLIAGTEKNGFSPDGSSASSSAISQVTGVAVALDGTVAFSDFRNHRVRRVDAQGRLQTIAGDGQARFSGDGGPATQASLNNPMGLAYDSTGNLYIADRGNGRVRMVAMDGRITTIAGPGVIKDPMVCPQAVAAGAQGEIVIGDPCRRDVLVIRNGQSSILGGTRNMNTKEPMGMGGPSTAASFDEWGVAAMGNGDVLIAGPDYGYLYRIDSRGTFSILAGTGSWRATPDGTSAKDALFQHPSRIAADSTGAIIVADIDGGRIYRIDAKGMATRLTGGGRQNYSGENVIAKDATINQAWGVRVRPNGTVVFSERVGSRIREITTDGKLRTIAGNGRAEYAGDGGKATAAALNNPLGICLDDAGNIYLADNGNNRIRKVGPDGTIQLVAGNGMRGFSGDGGPAERASFSYPAAVESGPDGSLYIADLNNRRVRKISNGIVTTIAGNGGNQFAGDGGPATAASLTPLDLAVGRDRALYVLDSTSQRIRRIDLSSGIITTVAGNGPGPASGDGGPAIEAHLGSPSGLAFSAAGDLFITDFSTATIRVIRSSAGAAGNAKTISSISQPPISPASLPPGHPIQISADNLEIFVRGKIGVWTEEDAKTIFGAVREQRDQPGGKVLVFNTPRTNFLTVSFVVGANGKVASAELIPGAKVKWNEQLAYMKTKYPGDEPSSRQSGTGTLYRFDRAHTSFLVQPDGTLASITVF